MITCPKSLPRTTKYSLGDATPATSGANSLVQPERLAPGSAQDILNMFWDGGSLTVRPGFTGQLDTAHGAAVYLSRTRYMLSSGTARIPYTTGGKIYYWELGASAGTEITKPAAVSFSMTSSAVRWCVIGQWLYFLDSADTTGSLWRVNLASSTTAEAVRGFTAPVEAPVATLRDGSVLVSSLGTKTWTGTTGSRTNLIPSGDEDFQGATGFWAFTAGADAANNLDADGGSAPCVELDADGGTVDYVGFTAPVSLPSNTSRLLYVSARYAATENTGASDSAQVLKVRVYGCNSSGDRVVTLEQDSTGANQTPTQVFRGVFDFRAYPDVAKVDIEFSSPTAVGTKGVDVRQVSAYAPTKVYSVTNSSGTAILKQGDLLSYSSTLYCANVPALATITSANYSAFDTVSADVKLGENVTTPLSMRLGLKVGSAWFYSQPATVVDGLATFDISLIKASLTAVVQLAFEPLNDLFITDSTDLGTSEVFRVSTLRTPGNLTNLLNYAYVWTQAKDSTATVEGSGSPFSGFVEATRDKARVSLSLKGASGTAPTLDSGATHIPIYRLGGATPDGDSRARRIAIVESGTDSASPSGTTQDDPTNLWFWDASEWTFYDNTPDDSLLDAEVYQISRDMVPLGGTCLTHHAGRLWLGVYDSTYKVNRLYASWLLDGINTWPYMSEATDPQDPELDVKGWLAGVGGVGSGDRIVAFSTVNLDPQNNRGASLSVLRQSAPPSLVSGWEPSTFALNPSPDNRGGGCVAAEGVEGVNGTTVYVAATGLVQSGGVNLNYLSETQEGAFSLEVLGKTRYAQTFLLWHARRLWAMYPGSSDDLGEARVWDERTSSWCRVTGYQGLGFTSGCSLSGGEDTGAVYFGGRDGQIYLWAGTVAAPTATVDKATPSGTARAISWTFKSRRHGQADAGTAIRYALNKVTRLFVDFYAASAFSLSWTVSNENSETSTGTYGVLAGRTTKNEIREIGDNRGSVHDVTLSGSTTGDTTLHSYMVETVDLGETR